MDPVKLTEGENDILPEILDDSNVGGLFFSPSARLGRDCR